MTRMDSIFVFSGAPIRLRVHPEAGCFEGLLRGRRLAGRAVVAIRALHRLDAKSRAQGSFAARTYRDHSPAVTCRRPDDDLGWGGGESLSRKEKRKQFAADHC